jgi:hypothetical protein
MTQAHPFPDDVIEDAEDATVHITRYFDSRLVEFEKSMTEADHDHLVEIIAQEVIPLLERSPSIGRRVLELHPDGDESPPMMSELLHRAEAAGGDLLVYAFAGCRLLYLHAGDAVYLLSIRRDAA